MNNLDKQYQQLLQDIIEYGVEKKDRTGTGTKSVFGYTIRHNMKDGFPLLTNKKMAWKTMVTELLWFLRGDTNIKYLVDNGCHIWDGDAYKNYISKIETYTNNLILPNDLSEFQESMDIVGNQIKSHALSKEEFINKIKTDDKFAKKWGELGPIYGKQWRNLDIPKVLTIKKGKVENGIGTEWGSWERNPIDQIQNLINELKTNPDSRRLIVSAWNVGELDQMVLPPCHYGFQVYTRELSIEERVKAYEEAGYIKNIDPLDYAPKRAISLMWNQRSVDTFLGLPFNIASYGLLLMLLGKLVNMVPQNLIGNLGDTHLYLNHLEQAQEQISRSSFDLPKVDLNFDFTFRDGHLVAWDKVKIENIELKNYNSHSVIKAPLSN